MAHAEVNPEQLRRFASNLDQTTALIRDQKSATVVASARLHETWKDEKFVRFEQSFTEAMRQLEHYLQQAERYSEFLKKKAARAQKYLDQG